VSSAAYGDVLRHRLRATMRNPLMAVLAGCGLSIALQSSTAVTLLVGSFAGAGIVSGMSGQLAVRGAEIGSGTGGQAPDLRPYTAGAGLPCRRHHHVHGHRAARLRPVRPAFWSASAFCCCRWR